MNSELRIILDQMLDILARSGISSVENRIEQLFYLIYLRLVEERHPHFFDTAPGYRWSLWSKLPPADLSEKIQRSVFPFMAGLYREDRIVGGYFRDAVLKIENPEDLKKLVILIDRIPFSRLRPDETGSIVEYALNRFNVYGSTIEFRTPQHLRALMVQLVAPQLDQTVYDPACGTGGLLTEALEFVAAANSLNTELFPVYGETWLDEQRTTIGEAREHYPNLMTIRRAKDDSRELREQISLHGHDVSRVMVRIARLNLLLHGASMSCVHLKRANTLTRDDGLEPEDLERRYDVILCSPPFGLRVPRTSVRPDVPVITPQSELLFLGVAMKSLRPGGRAAIVVPDSVLSGSSEAHILSRRHLLDHHELLAVISLPAGLWKPLSSLRTHIVVLRSPAMKRPSSSRVWFYELKYDGFDLNRMVNKSRSETPHENDIPELLKLWQCYKDTDFKSPPEPDGFERDQKGKVTSRYWSADLRTIRENDYLLLPELYRPSSAARAQDQDPVELVEDALGQGLRHLERVRKLQDTLKSNYHTIIASAATWEVLPFLQAIQDCTPTVPHMKLTDTRQEGKYPVITQARIDEPRYTDDERLICRELPVILFGDHTRTVKYADKLFAVGGDGIKILRVRSPDRLLPKFLYFYLHQVSLPSRGYSRHFAFLKELFIPIPPVPVQKALVELLDQVDEVLNETVDERNMLIQLLNVCLGGIFSTFAEKMPTKSTRGESD